MIKKVNKYNLGEEPDDKAYWLSVSPSERLDALEKIRQQYIRVFYNSISPSIQRVCRIIDLSEKQINEQ